MMTFDAVMAQLAKHTHIDGLLTVGSATDQVVLNAASDYDLIMVLSEMPAPLHVGLTYIDRRLTDIIFVKTQTIERILALDKAVDADDWMGRTIRWLQEGRIIFDRSGRLEQARQKIQSGTWIQAAAGMELYSDWVSVNYNVQQNRRMLQSDDLVYRQALGVRLLYCLSDLFVGYFRFRQLLWEGEKHAIRYLSVHDSDFLDRFNACLAETDLVNKLQLYEELALLTTAPLGGLWPDGATAMQLEGGTALEPEMINRALNFWESLISEEGGHG